MEPSIFFYVELEGEDLDILPLYELFSKYSCYGSHAGDTYYTYDADGTKHAHTRTKPYFQARLEYQSPTETRSTMWRVRSSTCSAMKAHRFCR